MINNKVKEWQKEKAKDLQIKTDNKLKKIRVIAATQTGDVIGVSLSKSLTNKWLGVYVSVEESGNTIILRSGSQPTALNKLELDNCSEILEEVTL